MIYIFAADGFEESELIVPLDMLRRAGLETAVVGVTGMSVTGAHGVKIQAELPLESADIASAEMIMLPGGGPGTKNLLKSADVALALKKAADNDIYIAAICAAPTVVAAAGLIGGRRFTCFPGCEIGIDGVYTAAPTETDGKLITGKAAGAAFEFGAALIAALRGRTAAEKVKSELYYSRQEA